MTLRVMIDGFYLRKQRGMGRYTRELLYSLGRFKPEELSIHVVLPKVISSESYILPNKIHYHSLPSLPFPLWEQLLIPCAAWHFKPDVVHSPYNTKPLIFNLGYQRHVVTVHDLMFVDHTHKVGSWYQWLGNLYRRWVAFRLRTKSQSVVTVSHHSQAIIRERLGFVAHVVYPPSEYFCSTATSRVWPQPEKPYFYHIGGASPNKNTARCIEAFLSSGLDGFSVVVSGTGKDSALADKYSSEKVIFTGWIDDEALASYYRQALAVVFPSLQEGFGSPVVEAMGFGVPLITSRLDPMQEVAGDAALFVDPYSTDDIAAAMRRVAADVSLRERLIEKGGQRVAEINSETMAQRVYKTYKRALAE